MPSFGGEVKPSVPSRRIEACKRSLQMAWNSPFVGKITGNFLPIVPPFPARGVSRRGRHGGIWRCKWELPKPGSYNKPTWLQYFRKHQPPGPSGRRNLHGFKRTCILITCKSQILSKHDLIFFVSACLGLNNPPYGYSSGYVDLCVKHVELTFLS
jgi:hypothetical protein